MTSTIALALILPQFANIHFRLVCILVIDTSVAVIAWWLVGPSAGPDFLLLIIAGVAGIALTARRWLYLVLLVLAAELTQIPLHFWAKYGPDPPLFHPPAQVVGDGAFVAGVVVRLLILALTAWLFRFVGRRLSEAQTALVESEATFKAAFEEAPTGVALIDTERTLIRFNQHVVGLLDEQVRSPTTDHLVHTNDQAILRAGVNAVLAGDSPRFDAELASGPNDEERARFLRISISPVEAGAAAGVMTIEDFTERVENRRRLEELIRSQRRVRRLGLA